MRISHVRTAAAVIVLTALVCVVAASGDEPILSTKPDAPRRSEVTGLVFVSPTPGRPPETSSPEAIGLDPPGPPAWLWWVLGAILAAAVVWVAVKIVRELMRVRWRGGRREPWRRRTRTAPRESPAIEPVEAVQDEAAIAREAVDAALAPLREPADPRAAVIEAYARMEHVLASRHLGRQTAEAPREYLRRVMRDQGMPEESLTALTALFEEARYSRHPIPRSAQARAVIELQTARLALAGVPPQAAEAVQPNDERLAT